MPVVERRKPIQVQLAKVYEGGPLPRPMWVEPKFDGLRGVIILPTRASGIPGRALTRTGMDVPNATFIGKELGGSAEFEGMVLDGEFLATNWNYTQSIVKTQTIHPHAHTLQFHVFDLLSIVEWEHRCCVRPLELRYADLARRIDNYDAERVKLVPHVVVNDEEQVRFCMKKLCEAGYEGAMLKDPTAKYLFKKTDVWLKVKPFFEADLRITGLVEGRGKYKGSLGALEVAGTVEWKGQQLGIMGEVGTGFDDATRKRLWEAGEQCKGCFVEVEFQEITEDGKMRFPSFRRLREDK
jgi:DNA ligase-1